MDGSGAAGSGGSSVVSGNWTTLEFGAPGTLLYRVLFLDDRFRAFSPWHDIPMHTSGGGKCLNYVCKTPRGLWAKLEVAKEENFNPIKLAERRGSPAHFAENLSWNLGFLPQTWADPGATNEEYGGIPYDGSPVEVVEIGTRTAHVGDVYPVKPLAAFAAINSLPEIAWKVVAIAADDPLATRLNDVADVHRELPGVLEEIREWLRLCDCLDEGEGDVGGQGGGEGVGEGWMGRADDIAWEG